MSKCRAVVAVIIHHIRLDLTKACITSLNSLDSRPSHVIVVLNGNFKREAFDDLRSGFSELVLLMVPNQGYSAALNKGIRKAGEYSPQYIWILNNDIVFPNATALDSALATFRSFPNVAATSLKSCYLERPNIIEYAGGQMTEKYTGWPRGQGEIDNGHYHDESPTEWVSGSNMLISMRALLEIGPFDEQYFLYMEDVDWSVRARELGYLCMFSGKDMILHRTHASTSKVRDFYFPRANLIFVNKHFPEQLGSVLRLYYSHEIYPRIRTPHRYRELATLLKAILSAFRKIGLRSSALGVRDLIAQSIFD